jgi:ABC-type transporter Mla subunit MlaD
MWWLVVVMLGGGSSVVLCVVFHFVPSAMDLRDPLGRPVILADSIVHSAGEFDRLSQVLLPKQAVLTRRIGVLGTVADSLGGVVDTSDALSPLVVTINDNTRQVIGNGAPLPALVSHITARAQQAGGVAEDLGRTVTSLNGGFVALHDRLQTLSDSLNSLGLKADRISTQLTRIEKESQRIRPLSPALRALSEATRH